MPLKIYEASFPIMYIKNIKNIGWITKGFKVFYLCKRSLYILNRNCSDSKYVII